MWALKFPVSAYSSSGRPTELWMHGAFSYLNRAAFGTMVVNLSRNVSLLLPSNHWTIGIVTTIDHSTRMERQCFVLWARAFEAMYTDVSSVAIYRYLGALHKHIIFQVR